MSQVGFRKALDRQVIVCCEKGAGRDEVLFRFFEPAGDALGVDQLLYASDVGGNLEIYVRPIEGGAPVQLTNDPQFDSWRPRLSPDRSTIMFYRTPVGVGVGYSTESALWMMTPQGVSPLEVLPRRSHGWTRHGHAEWSPSGDELVMMGERPNGSQIWITTTDGRAIRSLVSDPGLNADPSWDPTGQRVLYVACPTAPCDDAQREVFAILSAGGDRVQITNDDINDAEPRFSPDGSSIVMRSEVVVGIPDDGSTDEDESVPSVWDIRIVPTNRSRAPQRVMDDDSTSDAPFWLDDQTVLFHNTPRGQGDADVVRARLAPDEVSVLVEGPGNQLFPAG